MKGRIRHVFAFTQTREGLNLSSEFPSLSNSCGSLRLALGAECQPPALGAVLRMLHDRILEGAFPPLPFLCVGLVACRPGAAHSAPPREFISLREAQRCLGIFSFGAIFCLTLS